MIKPVIQLSIFFFLVLLIVAPSLAVPYTPEGDKIILERLPTRPNSPEAKALRDLRAALTKDPTNLALATKLARQYYAIAARDGDLRFIGYAQAAIYPWWDLSSPPHDILLLRASIHQLLHNFDLALADLNQLLKQDSKNVEALSLRSAIYFVQANYTKARQDCEAMIDLTSELIRQACLSNINALLGNNEASYKKLLLTYLHSKNTTKEQKLWVLTRLAEMAQRAGKHHEAYNHYKEALALEINDSYLLGAYSDFLLDLKRPHEVIKLLADKTRSDILLLRLALAEQQIGSPLTDEHVLALKARFDAATQRAQRVHLQEEARFVLNFSEDANLALKLALENWQTQREPKDARIILEAALAAHRLSAAKPVLDWLKQTKHEDKIILRLADYLKDNGK